MVTLWFVFLGLGREGIHGGWKGWVTPKAIVHCVICFYLRSALYSKSFLSQKSTLVKWSREYISLLSDPRKAWRRKLPGVLYYKNATTSDEKKPGSVASVLKSTGTGLRRRKKKQTNKHTQAGLQKTAEDCWKVLVWLMVYISFLPNMTTQDALHFNLNSLFFTLWTI